MCATRLRGPSGLAGFTVVWCGQLMSLLGSGMTGFAITIWAYELTGAGVRAGSGRLLRVQSDRRGAVGLVSPLVQARGCCPLFTSGRRCP